MRLAWRIAAMSLPVSLQVLTQVGFAQSPSIVRTGAGETRIDAVAPTGTRDAVEESRDLSNWYRVADEVLGPVSLKNEMVTNFAGLFRLIEWTEPPPPIILAWNGDSTIRDGQIQWDFSGWGGGFPADLRPESQVVNFVGPCSSTSVLLRL